MAPGDFDQFFLPRHSGLYAGVRQEVPALMAQRICGTGFKLGAPIEFKDYMWEALNDPAAGISMIQTAENLAVKYGITREEVDIFASSKPRGIKLSS